MSTQDTTVETERRSSEMLREIFLNRKERNPQYSTRAFARDIGISQTLVSLIMNGKRSLTLTQAMKITASLESSKRGMEEADTLLKVALATIPAGAKILKKMGVQEDMKNEVFFLDLEIARMKVITQWYHVPILDLSTTKSFRSDPVWIAKRLGINPVEAKDAMERLLMLGLAEEKNGVFRKSHAKIYFPTKSSEAAVRSFHQQMIGKALDQLSSGDKEAFEAREISGMTMAISKEKLPEAKKRIKAFQQEFAAFMTDAVSCEEVYQLNVQLFPLTRELSGEKNEN